MYLKKQFTLAESEQALRQIEALEADEPLKIPPDASHLSAGGEAALIQVLTTWARRQHQAKLQFWAKGHTAATGEHTRLLDRFYGVVASACADAYIDAASEGTEWRPMRAAFLNRLAQLQSPRPREGLKGPMWATVCVDHINRPTSYTLYEDHGAPTARLRTKEEFYAVVTDILRATSSNRPRLLNSTEITAIADMTYELFRNTEEHAKIDVAGYRIAPSVRGILAQAHALSPSKLAQLAGGFEPFSEYCARLPLSPFAETDNDLAQSPLLEVSIFDSGPGFAPTISKRSLTSMSDAEEVAFVRQCFQKNATSKNRPGFGQGLTQVMKVLAAKRGFLRLRTGRLAFYADLGENRPLGDQTDLTSWAPAGGRLPEVAGSVLSLFIPLHAPT